MTCKLDILMSVYNCDRYILETLISIQNQTFTDYRLIIVDDGSIDRTGEIIRQVAETDNRIQYYRQNNAGIVAALNHGLQHCSAPFIARHDGDDISYPERFERELAYLQKNPDCVAVSSYVDLIDEQGKRIERALYTYPTEDADAFSIPAREPYIPQPMLMMRAKTFIEAGGYRYLPCCEDTDLYWRLKHLGHLGVIPTPLGSYRIHPNSTTSGSHKKLQSIAIWSQLSAISEQRRQTGHDDIRFSCEFMSILEREDTFNESLHHAEQILSPCEKRWFLSSAAAKIMEMYKVRFFLPNIEEISIIKQAFDADPNIKEHIIATAVILNSRGHIEESKKFIKHTTNYITYIKYKTRVIKNNITLSSEIKLN